MPRPGSILRAAAVAAAAALLASGCEYWRNLTQEIVPDQAAVTLIVRDALTGEPLPEADCGKRGQQAFRADGYGVIARDDMPTGQYVLVCEAPGYRPREQAFELRLGQTRSDTVRLVRKGGKDWYPGVEHRRVDIEVLKANNMYPGTLVVKALPNDSSGRFLYEWSSNLHEVPPESPDSICTLHTPASELPSQTLRLGLKVKFKPEGETQLYLVDSTAIQMDLSRNKPPVIHLDTNFFSKKVGCPDQTNVFDIVYRADDEDLGGCASVRITSQDPLSPAGLIDTVVPCTRGGRVFSFEVKPHRGSLTEAIKDTSLVHFQVLDKNGESDTTTFIAESVTNIPPTITMDLLGLPAYVFTSTQVRCSLYVNDAEGGKVQNVILNWGDGTILTIPMGLVELPYSKVFDHRYDAGGDYTIAATVNDRCAGTTTNSKEMYVWKNSLPTFKTVNPMGVDPETGEFRLNVEVEDLDTQLNQDTLGLYVNWDYGQHQFDTTYYGEPNRAIRQVLRHRFDSSGAAPEYRIRLQAFDQHDDKVDTMIVIPKRQALPSPPPRLFQPPGP